MPSKIEFKNFVLDQLRDLQNIEVKRMMGEYLLYYNKILFGGIYDDRLLIKKTINNQQYSLPEQIPYKNAKPMYLVENLDDCEYLANLVISTCVDLKQKRPSK